MVNIELAEPVELEWVEESVWGRRGIRPQQQLCQIVCSYPLWHEWAQLTLSAKLLTSTFL